MSSLLNKPAALRARLERLKSAIQPLADLRAEASAYGMELPKTLIADGKPHGCPGKNKGPGNTAGWYAISTDRLHAAYGDHSTGLKKTWRRKNCKPLTRADRRALARGIERANKQKLATQINVAREVGALLNRLKMQGAYADSRHPYLVDGRIGPHDILQVGNDLVIPLTCDGVIWNYQIICGARDENGKFPKYFAKGGRIDGCYHAMGEMTEFTTMIAMSEGFRTGATLNEISGLPSIVAIDAGNMPKVAKTLPAKFPSKTIVIGGDVDRSGTGQMAARKAVSAIKLRGGRAVAVFPPFSHEELARNHPPSDWNDYCRLHGPKKTKAAFEAAIKEATNA